MSSEDATGPAEAKGHWLTRNPNKLYCWDELEPMEVVNMYQYLPFVIEHNLKESWKAEKQFNFLCIRKLTTEFSFPLHFSYPKWLSALFHPSLHHPCPPISIPLSSLESLACVNAYGAWPIAMLCLSQALNVSNLGKVCVQPA